MVTSTIEAPCYHVNKGKSNKRDFVFEDFQLSIDTANKKKKKKEETKALHLCHGYKSVKSRCLREILFEHLSRLSTKSVISNAKL